MLHPAARRDLLDLELARRYHEDHDLRARDELVERSKPLVRSLARRFVGRGETFEDLVQVGLLGLVRAIDRFEASPGNRFVSFAAPTITGEIRRHFRDHCWAVHVPRAAQELAARINVARVTLAAQSGREPTVAEVAEHLGAPVDDVLRAVAAGQGYAAQPFEGPGGDGPSSVLDRYGAEDTGYDLVDDQELLRGACSVLDSVAAEVVRQRFVEGRLQREIAEDIGVSQMQVSRIISSSLARMRVDLAQARQEPDALTA